VKKIIFLATIIAAYSINPMDHVYIRTSNDEIISVKEAEILAHFLPLGLISDRIATEKRFPDCFIQMFYSEEWQAKSGARTGIFITDKQGKQSFAFMTKSDLVPSTISFKKMNTTYEADYEWHVKQYMYQDNIKPNDGYYLEFNS
jgi:hypothetical protein